MPEKLKYIVVGRTASGKSTLLSQLKNLGFKITESYTTRPKRHPDETGYTFINTQEMLNLKNDGIILETEFNGYYYFTTRARVMEADVLLLDPQGVYDVTAMFPDIMFRILYINGTDEDKRKLAYLQRFDDEHKIDGEMDFEARDDGENERFVEFERKLWNGNLNIPNIRIGKIIGNDYTVNSDIFSAPDALVKEVIQYERADIILKSVIDNDIISTCDFITLNEDGTLSVVCDLKTPEYDEDENEITTKIETFTYGEFLEIMCSDASLFGCIAGMFLLQDSIPDLNNISFRKTNNQPPLE